MASDSKKPQYNLQPFYMAIFLFRQDWIRGPKASTEVQLFALETALGENGGPKAGTMGIKRGSSFLRVKRDVKKSGHLSP